MRNCQKLVDNGGSLLMKLDAEPRFRKTLSFADSATAWVKEQKHKISFGYEPNFEIGTPGSGAPEQGRADRTGAAVADP